MDRDLKLCLTEEDVRKAHRFKVRNPILYALQRTTGTLWRMCDDGLLIEVMEPFRAYQLPAEALKRYEDFEINGTILPFECDLEIHTPPAPLIKSPSHPESLHAPLRSHQRPCPRRLREAARADGGW